AIARCSPAATGWTEARPRATRRSADAWGSARSAAARSSASRCTACAPSPRRWRTPHKDRTRAPTTVSTGATRDGKDDGDDMSTTEAPPLTYDVSVNDPPPQDGVLPNGEPKLFSPMASTLISGAADAVLTDPGMTTDQARALGDWVASKGKNLTDIFVT